MTGLKKLRALVIHAPDQQVGKPGKKAFEAILASGVGPGYAIYPAIVNSLSPGTSPVILLRKDRKRRRAQGVLIRLAQIPQGALNGVQRYDVHIGNLLPVPYKPEKLNHCGVALV